MKRLIALLFLITSLLYGDWWLTLFIALFFSLFFQYPAELIFAAFWVDLVYGGGRAGYAPYFPVTISAVGVFVLATILRRSLFIHGNFSEKKRFYRD